MDESAYLATALLAHRGEHAVPELTSALGSMAEAGQAQAAVIWYEVLIELLRLASED